MTLKMVATFREVQEGWSEVHYIKDRTITEYVRAFAGQNFNDDSEFGTWLSERRLLLTREAFIEHVRVSDMAIPGAFLTHDFDPPRGQGRYKVGGLQKPGAEIFSSLLINLQSGLTRRRPYYLGGLPEEVIQPPQTYISVDPFSGRLANYMSTVARAPYCVHGRPRANPTTDARITNFTVSASGRTARVTPAVVPVGDPNSWYVMVRGLKTPPGWNGVHQARKSEDAGVIILGPTRKSMKSVPAFNVDNGGAISLYVAEDSLLNDWEVVRIVSRRRGRPFGLPRGRRS